MTQPDRSNSRGRSRCDVCEKRIGPARYELGLCPGCEALAHYVDAQLALWAILRLVNDQGFLKVVERHLQDVRRRAPRPDGSGARIVSLFGENHTHMAWSVTPAAKATLFERFERSRLAVVWALFAEPQDVRPRGIFAIAAESFAQAMRAAGDPINPATGLRYGWSQAERAQRIEDRFLADEITARSLDLELGHLPGGLPPI
jgi:hypothetical protein